MKTKMGKKIIAFLLAGVMALSYLPTIGFADNGGTIAGTPETIKVSSTELARNNNFNDGWKLYLGDNKSAQNVNFDDSRWKSVTLPHDFSISQNFTTSGEAESGFLPGGTGWYRKSFTLPESMAGKEIVLSFDGVYSNAYVYVNGTQVGENHYGYNAFAFDITNYVTCDGTTENVIAVKAVNNIPSSRWYSGSGIYRDVTLIVTDPVHVELNGTKVTTPNIANGNGTVNVEVEVKNDSNTTAGVTVRNTVVDSDGNTVVTAPDKTISVSAGAAATTTTSGTVSNPTLWDIDNPVQYKVVTEVLVNGTIVDTYTTNFGFRYYSFDKNNGFYLNGRAVKLNGVCMHHDQGALGSAAYYDAMYRQLSIMKDMGANAIRTSHNTADEHFIDICNKLGLLVIEEAFDGWTYAKNDNSNDFSRYFNTSLTSDNQILGGSSSKTWSQYAIQSMVKRDRNDPSIIMWSLCNEVQEGGSSDSTYPSIAQNLINWIKELDTTRPATIGDNTRSTSASGNIGGVLNVIQNNGGVLGFNYGSDPYSSLNNAWTAPIYASETSSAVNSRGVYSTKADNSLNGSYHLTSYDTYAVSWGATAHDSMYRVLTKDYVAGEFVWTGFDYIGEPTPWNGTGAGDSGRGAIPNSSYFGIVETTGFEKDTYYLYRSQWNQNETTAHLVTAWDSDNMLTTSGKTPVVIYSNAPTVKLYLNGTQIGTATRKVNTTSAGHTYYTYTTASNNSNVCTAVSASGSASLYATFNVAYTAGTISVKAFDGSGREITNVGGKTSVSTPGSVTKLNVSVNKTAIAADGSSLAYITVDVEDANGNLDTTASNTINFSLTGNGEIVGVDNGDQATTAKYQQSSVLSSTTSAHINAYAGKALVIVRSTKDAGSFTVNCTSSGLTGGSATVTTTAVTDGSDVQTGLASYTMVRDYTVKAGTVPTLQPTAAGTLADGTEVNGTIAWNSIPAATYNTPGDYTVNGVLTIAGETIPVTAKLHVIADVIAMRNVATATMAGQVPTLPSTVSGVLADGTPCGEFTVVWDAMTESQFQTIGGIVVVNGTATVMGNETLPVTASVRVAETVNTSSTNVATAAHVSQDIPTEYQSDNLSSVNNGVTTPGDNTRERWSNWKNRTNSAKATLTLTWDTAQMLSSVNIYYYLDNCATVPESVIFSYSMNGVDYSTISYVAAEDETVHNQNERHRMFTYTFAQPVNPVALQIEFTQQSGTTGTHCVAVSEIETMTFAGSIEYQTSAALSSLLVDGVSVPNFNAATYAYTAAGSTVTAESAENTGITILPAYKNVVRVLVLSEDGQTMNTYAVTLTEPTGCQHNNTEIRNASEATCTEAGYTGDTYCTVCGEKLSTGSAIPAKGHTTETRNAKAATCTEAGYTGDKICTVCGVTVETGTTIPAKGHTWNSGVVTKQPTTTEEGVKTYTCTVCGATKTETIAKLEEEIQKSVPSVTLTTKKGTNGKISLTGNFTDYENADKYYTVTKHGFVYYSSSKLGTKTLTVDTPGRTRVNVNGYKETGSYTYSMTPTGANVKYTVRAFLEYMDEYGNTKYVYSAPVSVSYNTAEK